ncbi:DUF6268 family outer membrane beta-barrel protein [Mangrovimonas sp. DI 80]|uniref:DUF6268 family outer membrane beta-barrel protein n=1 Tax=Mangrovimonas sp. DI 80 TaxID=1779330 RepID=UPI0009C8DCE3|nr:DUF6268 family outer membrane beta-barrel protein [Mangrovimonas sp. DI 80]OMP32488.1 hypothetical protein BKM32_05440 [Mangrovimonas sp. DI 80]
MKNFWFLLIWLPSFFCAQNYVDVLQIRYAYTPHSNFENTPNHTDVNSFETVATVPFPINESTAIIAGANFTYNNLELFPNDGYSHLYNTTLRLGINTKLSNTWQGTFIALPKIASDYQDISSDDFYLGGLAIFKNQRKSNLFFRYGLYLSQEAFGVTTTPILGMYYLSNNQLFEADLAIPLSANINYTLPHFKVGVDYLGIERSYHLHSPEQIGRYVEQNRLEFASYIEFNTFNKQVLLRSKLGYATNRHAVFDDDDTIGLKVIDFRIDDKRTQLNPKLKGSLFFKIEAIYRFHLNSQQN